MNKRIAIKRIIEAGHARMSIDIKEISRESNGSYHFQIIDSDHSEGGPTGYVHADGKVEGLY